MVESDSSPAQHRPTEVAQGASPTCRRRRARQIAGADGLFPGEAVIARRLSQTPTEWRAKAAVLERHGLPRIDPLMGGRYWPAVQAFWNRKYGLSQLEAHQPEGEEDLSALR